MYMVWVVWLWSIAAKQNHVQKSHFVFPTTTKKSKEKRSEPIENNLSKKKKLTITKKAKESIKEYQEKESKKRKELLTISWWYCICDQRDDGECEGKGGTK